MREIYRKRGSTVRYENGIIVRVCEVGEAIEEDGIFRCAPLRDVNRLPDVDPRAVRDVARQIESIANRDVLIERLVVTDGVAEHEFGDVRWSDEARRLHVAFVCRETRVLIDQSDFDVSALPPIAAALSRIGGERAAPPRVILEPRVLAALAPSLVDREPPNTRVVQVGGGMDGKGQPIASGPAPWQNWYRPSYRVRPQRAPMNIAVQCTVATIDRELPRALAILAPPDDSGVRVLYLDGDEAFPTFVRIARIDAITEPRVHYPYGAGVWAGEAEVTTEAFGARVSSPALSSG